MPSGYIVAIFSLFHVLASGAALVPIATPKVVLPIAGFEVNQGQVKPEVLFLSRGKAQGAGTARSMTFSPSGAQQSLVGSRPDTSVRYLDPLPGVANSFTGSDPQKWVTGIKRYATVRLEGVYPGVDIEYALSPDGALKMRVRLGPGADISAVNFELAGSAFPTVTAEGGLEYQLGSGSYVAPKLRYSRPVTYTAAASPANITARFELLGQNRFGLSVDGNVVGGWVETEIGVTGEEEPAKTSHIAAGPLGTYFAAATIQDSGGKNVPFATLPGGACGERILFPFACGDVAMYKFSTAGELIFVSYLAGITSEEVKFLGVAPNGDVVVTGLTNSPDFPVTAGSLQTTYAGPGIGPAPFSKQALNADLFATRIDAATGAPLASTYFGGPNADNIGGTVLGPDGSVYFLPVSLGQSSGQMPVSSNALQATCSNPCPSGYAAHLSAALNQLIFGTYLPGSPQTSRLHTDGSIYYAGTSFAGFPATAGAYKTQLSGEQDAIVARLGPAGDKLIFGTYIGGEGSDQISRMAVAQDGSVWAALQSHQDCCADIDSRVIHLDALGTRIIAERSLVVDDIAVDPDGNLVAIAGGEITASPEAPVMGPCSATSPFSYVKIGPDGHSLFSSYLPAAFENGFHGTSSRGLPILIIEGEPTEMVEGAPMGPYAGCVLDSAALGNSDRVSPGEIVTLFGSKLGPQQGVEFQLVNGRVPTALGGTRVLVNGVAIPLIYVSYGQINAILPFTLTVDEFPVIQVEVGGVLGNRLDDSRVIQAGVTLFGTPGPTIRGTKYVYAAALNEDGTLNTAANPAKKGSRIVLYGTGGGVTIPASDAGEISPLRARPVAATIEAGSALTKLLVDYAGSAPALIAGAIQVNVKLPDTLPALADFPAGALPMTVFGPPNGYDSGAVLVWVK